MDGGRDRTGACSHCEESAPSPKDRGGLKMDSPLCTIGTPLPVLTLRDMPVICNQLYPTAEAAQAAPVGDIELVRCPTCGLLWNASFDEARMVYAPGYENALHFSPRFQAFAEDLAAGLVERHGLAGRDVVEIGCGDGYFLDLMVKHGAATATGFDPSMRGLKTPFTERDGVAIVPEYFRSDQLDRSFDALLCRHVLEHIPTPLAFLTDVRKAIGSRDIPVYFEVPNAGWMLQAHSIWDVIYEHVTYWTAPAIEVALRRTGFEPVSITTGYGDQFLMAEARPAERLPDWVPGDLEDVTQWAQGFSAAAQSELDRWRDRLGLLKEHAVIWGAGSKGMTFANALGANVGALAAMVDLNPRKHGLWAPGIALPIVGPDALGDINPALVIVSNALYVSEITAQVREMGLNPDFDTIAG